MHRRSIHVRYQESKDAWLLIAPLLVLLLAFMLIPVVSNIWYSFTKWKGFGEPQWIGLDNYLRLISDDKFHIALKNTGMLLLYVPLGLIVPLVLSAIMRDGLPGWGIFKSILYLPNVLGYIILGILFSVFLRDAGPLNTLLRSSGLDGLAINWIGTTKSAIHVTGVLFVVWSKIGFGCIYFLAAMSSIDAQLYDAAKVDGARWWRIFFNVTVPSIRFAIEFWVVLLFIEVFARAFGFIFSLTYGGPGFSTWTLEFGIYILGFKNYQMGYGSAWAVVLFLFCALIAFVQIRLIRRSEA